MDLLCFSKMLFSSAISLKPHNSFIDCQNRNLSPFFRVVDQSAESWSDLPGAYDHWIGELDIKLKSDSWLRSPYRTFNLFHLFIYEDFSKALGNCQVCAVIVSVFNSPDFSFFSYFRSSSFLGFQAFSQPATFTLYIILPPQPFPCFPTNPVRQDLEDRRSGLETAQAKLAFWPLSISVFIIYSESNITHSLAPSGMLQERINLCLEKYPIFKNLQGEVFIISVC